MHLHRENPRRAVRPALIVLTLISLGFAYPLPARSLSFPTKKPLGKVSIRPIDAEKNSAWIELGPAKGAVKIPEDHHVSLRIPRGSAGDLSPLLKFKPDDLYRIDLSASELSGQGPAHLRKLTGLRELFLHGTRVNDVSIKPIGELTGLKALSLGSTRITDEGVRHLRGLTELESLSLRRLKLTDQCFTALLNLTKLKWLDLGGAQFSDVSMRRMKQFPALESLNVSDMKMISDDGLEALCELTQLKMLYVGGNPITNEGIANIPWLTNLVDLHLSSTEITNEGLIPLGRMDSLKTLWLTRTQITDEGLPHLKEMGSLLGLGLSMTRVTEAGVKNLQRSLPNCRIGYGTDLQIYADTKNN